MWIQTGAERERGITSGDSFSFYRDRGHPQYSGRRVAAWKSTLVI